MQRGYARLSAGGVIEKGSFGCVFKPPLLCEGETTRQPHAISKLLPLKEAKAEDADNERVRQAVASLPRQITQHFILGQRMCTPAPLDPVIDKENLRMCGYLGLTASRHPDAVGSITQEDGGQTVLKYVSSPANATPVALVRLFEQWIAVVRSLQALNATALMHGDIKDNNLVYDGTLMRVIDWGRVTSVQQWIDHAIPPSWSFVLPYLPPNMVAYTMQKVMDADRVSDALLATVHEQYDTEARTTGDVTQFNMEVRDYFETLAAPFTEQEVDAHYHQVLRAQLDQTVTALVANRAAQVNTVLRVNLDFYGMLWTLFRMCKAAAMLTQQDKVRETCLSLARTVVGYMMDDVYATTPFPIDLVCEYVQSALTTLSKLVPRSPSQVSDALSEQKTVPYEQPVMLQEELARASKRARLGHG